MNTLMAVVTYALFLCVESNQTCNIVTRPVITERGIEQYDEDSYTQEACQSRAAELSKAQADAHGHYVVQYNKWYECRAEKGDDLMKRRQIEGR